MLVDALTGFAQHVRQGNAGRGNQVRVGSVSKALGAIAKTFTMDDRHDPTKQNWLGPKHWARLKAQLDCYKRQDPPMLPQLAVPVTLTKNLLDQAFASTARTLIKRKQQATADLCNIAFYFLLRVGE